jgi:prepilin-type N-terminal cleavage/methylation domain-containing protein
MKTRSRSAGGRNAGFTLIELLVSMAILLTLMTAAVRIATMLVRSNNNQANNVDIVQEGRQFMDQISSDLHMSGYPNYRMFDQSSGNTPSANLYAGIQTSQGGIMDASPTHLTFEGDIDNSGQISVVYLQLCTSATSDSTTCTVPTAGTQCPCTLRRGTVIKATPLGKPSYYTELTGVMNDPSITPPFTYWEYNGPQVVPATDGISNIRTVRVELKVQSQHKDIASGMYSVITLDSETRLSSY